MQKIMECAIVRLLRQTGFEAASQRAVELLAGVHEDRLCALLSTLASRSILALRPGTSLVDLMGYIEDPRIFGRMGPARRARRKAGDAARDARAQLFSVVTPPKDRFEAEHWDEPKEWASPLSTRVEKFIHIYDFMPSFPPIHTFRLTLPKQTVQKNYSSRVKKRLEQSLKSEGNMIKLIKSSGSLPGYINYLYKKRG